MEQAERKALSVCVSPCCFALWPLLAGSFLLNYSKHRSDQMLARYRKALTVSMFIVVSVYDSLQSTTRNRRNGPSVTQQCANTTRRNEICDANQQSIHAAVLPLVQSQEPSRPTQGKALLTHSHCVINTNTHSLS